LILIELYSKQYPQKGTASQEKHKCRYLGWTSEIFKMSLKTIYFTSTNKMKHQENFLKEKEKILNNSVSWTIQIHFISSGAFSSRDEKMDISNSKPKKTWLILGYIDLNSLTSWMRNVSRAICPDFFGCKFSEIFFEKVKFSKKHQMLEKKPHSRFFIKTVPNWARFFFFPPRIFEKICII